MGFDCIVEAQQRGYRTSQKKRRSTGGELALEISTESASNETERRNEVDEVLPATYNFLFVEAGGLPLSERRMDALKAAADDHLRSMCYLDWLIDDRLSQIISDWADVELGSLFPLLPPSGLLRSQRQKQGQTTIASIEPSLLVLELSQYLCAARHLYLSPERQFPGVQIESVVRPILKWCYAEMTMSTKSTPTLCLAYQLLCIVRVDRREIRVEPSFAILSTALRIAQIARFSDGSDRDKKAIMFVWCSAYCMDMSYILGTKEGLLLFRPSQYDGMRPTPKELDEMTRNVDAVRESGFIALKEQVPIPEYRQSALAAVMVRTKSTLIFAKAWHDIWRSTKALREDKAKHAINDEEQLICLAQTGQAMSEWERESKHLTKVRARYKNKIAKTTFEMYEVEAQFSRTLLQGHCLRMQIESAIDVDVPVEFDGIGQETALLNYVKLLLTENIQAAREAFIFDHDKLQAAKALLAEQVGRLSGTRLKRGRAKQQAMVDGGYPALIALGHFFEAAVLVLEAHAPHLAVSRSSLAAHDSFALLAWAVKGLLTSLLLTEESELEENSTPSHADSTKESAKMLQLQNAVKIVERPCQHVETRMVLDLPFPLAPFNPGSTGI